MLSYNSVLIIMWRRLKVKYFVLLIFAFYLAVLRKCHWQNEFQEIVENVECIQVWDFMADFNNMVVLNPSLINFEILDESHGKNGEWNYEVAYTEYFEFLPRFMQNSAIGNYQVKKSEEGTYLINSQHLTCLFSGHFCLETKAQDKFVTVENNDCLIHESIDLQCPILLSPLCKAELNSQRKNILGNLQDQTFE